MYTRSSPRLLARLSLLGALLAPAALAPVLVQPSQAWAQDAWDVQGGDKRRQEIIRRYKLLLENNPTEGMFFQNLLKETGKGAGLDKLIEEYEAKAKANPKAVKHWLILGHLLKAKGRYADALVSYDEAVKLDAANPLGYLGRGSAAMMLGKNQEAGRDFEEALKVERDRAKKQEILRKLADIAFAQRDWDGAQRYYDQLIALNPRDEYLRMEYAQVLVKYKRYDKALEQYEALIKIVAGNTKARATTLRDMGELYEQMGDEERALKTYAQAMTLVRPDNWLHRELDQRILGVYRRSDRLQEYLEQKLKAWANPTYDQAMTLASIYDELGQETEALKHYQRASAKNPRSVDPRTKIIQILQRRGEHGQVLKAYEALIRVDAAQSRYHFELAKLHFRSGDRKRAEQTLGEIRRRFRRDPDVMVQLADLYMRMGMGEDALKVYQDLVASNPRNDSFIISLGEYYHQSGEVDKAISTWRKVLAADLSKAEANARLGQVLVDHNMIDKGLTFLEKAAELAPKDREIQRALANAYEAARRWDQAIAVWQQLLAMSEQPQSASEARGRIINLYQRQNRLRPIMRELEQRFAKTPPELDAGFLLAEAHLKLGERERAEQIYRRLIDADGVIDQEDIDAMVELEKLYSQRGKNAEAIALLERLAQLRPLRAKDYYYRIAELSLKTFEDAQAVRYAQLAVEKNPDDATSHARMAEVYAKMKRPADAIKSLRTAIDLDPRAFEHYLALAALLQDQGDVEGARALYRDVAVKAMDEQMILSAARKAMNLTVELPQLEQLEAELAPLVFRSPPRPVYRKLMMELYGRLLSPLITRSQYSVTPPPAQERQRQEALALRALPVLMDALSGEDVGQRQLATKMLGQLRLGNAALALARMVEDSREPLRVQAAHAVAMIGDDRAALSLLRALDEKQPLMIRTSAMWALGSCGDRASAKAIGALIEAVWAVRNEDGSYRAWVAAPTIEGGAPTPLTILGALALGRLRLPEGLPALRALAERGAASRYADSAAMVALWALGELRDEASLERLGDALERGAAASKQAAAYALARIGSADAFAMLLRAYWSPEEGTRQVARRSLMQLAQPSMAQPPSRDALLRQMHVESRFVEERAQQVNVHGLVELLHASLSLAPLSDPTAVLLAHKAKVEQVLVQTMASSDAQAQRRALSDLASPELTLGLGGALAPSAELAQARVAWLGSVHASLRAELSQRDPERVMLAAQLLGVLARPEDLESLVALAASPTPMIRQQAVRALSQGFAASTQAQRAIVEGLKAQDYLVRVASAQALARMAPLEDARGSLEALLTDAYPSAQIAAAQTLGAWRSAPSVEALGRALGDSTLQLQIELVRALAQINTPEARQRVEPFKRADHLGLRRAAQGL